MARRRTRHEGTIYQRPDGRWAASLSLGYQAGKRLRRTVYGRSMAEARGRLEALRRRYQAGLSLDSERLTLAQHLSAWLEDRARVVRYQTLQTYRCIIELHLVPALGPARLDALRPEQIRRMVAGWQKAAPSTVRQRLRVLKIALESATRDGLIARNPCQRVQLAPVPRKDRPTLSAEQAKLLIAAAPKDRLGALYVLALTCGLRRGELLGLSWSAVELEATVLHVREVLQRIEGEYRLVPPKTASSLRSVALSVYAVEALRQHRAKQAAERLAAGALWRDSGLVFTGLLGQPLSTGTVPKLYRQFLAGSGLPALRLHDLRHTCATLFLELGAHQRVVADILGHASTAITQDLYSHVRPKLQHEAMAKLDRLLQ